MKRHVNIIDTHDCCGCTACQAVCPQQCIVMQADYLGFSYPEVDEGKCIECGLCEKTCPFQNPHAETEPINCHAAYNTNEEELTKSSSGGIFIALARMVIEKGGVVLGASFNEDWSVSHRSAQTMEEITPMMTSKYLQSRMESSLSETKVFLNEGRQVLFTGTPCQIAGLKHFLRKEYPNLLAVEVICHGVPSPAVWKNYLEEILDRPEGGPAGKNTVLPSPLKSERLVIANISFRDKRLGWEKYGFAVSPRLSAYGDAKNSASPSNIFEPFSTNVYIKAFLRNWSLRPSCFACQAKCGKSQADITIGDFWGARKVEGIVVNDQGTSCVICRTPKGSEAVIKLHSIHLQDVTYDQILTGNPSLEQSVSETEQAKKFRKFFPKRGFTRTMANLEHTPLHKRIIMSLRYRISLLANK